MDGPYSGLFIGQHQEQWVIKSIKWWGIYKKRLDYTDVYIKFERCHPYSRHGFKDHFDSAKQQHHFNIQSSLPSQSVSLTITENKAQINDILIQNLICHFQESIYQRRRVIISSDHIPGKVHNSMHTRRRELWQSVMAMLMVSSVTDPYH